MEKTFRRAGSLALGVFERFLHGPPWPSILNALDLGSASQPADDHRADEADEDRLPDPAGFAYVAIVSVALLLVSWLAFHRSEFKFAENV